MSPRFNSDIKQFTTPAAFAAYLSALPRPAWRPHASTFHNTYRPTEAMWRGRASMLSIQAGYEAKGWTAGPHVFLALGSPNPAHDGVWMMTPPTSPGVHGVACNSTHFGIEVVGDFQAKQPSPAQQLLLIETVAALHRWAGLGPVLNAHRDCVERTCPGDAFYALKSSLIARLAAELRPPDPLRAATLPGIAGKVTCSEKTAQFYAAHGGLAFFGYPTSDERASIGSDGHACFILPCERAVIKTKATEAAHQALLREVFERGWV